jgi:hypothetical protein
VVDGFKQELDHLDHLDHRFDQRVPEILDGPYRDGQDVRVRWALEFRRNGLPPLRFEGDHRVTYVDGKISRLVEAVSEQDCAKVESYLAKYDDVLIPVGESEAAMPYEASRLAFEQALKRSFVSWYGSAKSRADIAGALAVCGEEFSIDTIPLGVRSTDRASTASSLELFFAAFPDYSVELEGVATNTDTATAWGTAMMTPNPEIFGEDRGGRTVMLPFFSVFDCKDGLLAKELFFFDLATLCRDGGLVADQLLEMAGSSYVASAA